MNNIPLIITNFNQLTYLMNIINWWHWYYPKNSVYILDNDSDYEELMDFYTANLDYRINVIGHETNDCAGNLKQFLDERKFDYYVISDPDIQPHPNTPPNFLEVFKALIDSGYHHAGFDLIYENLPDWLHDKANIEHNEKELHGEKIQIDVNGKEYHGFRAPIDTTFAMYTARNSGWRSPMDGADWGNSVRIFQAFHLGWYLHPDYINPEMDHYFKTCKQHQFGTPSAGENNNRPLKYKK